MGFFTVGCIITQNRYSLQSIMKLKYLVSGVIFLLIAIAIIYKLYERRFVGYLTHTFNSAIQSELQLLSEKTPSEKAAGEMLDQFFLANSEKAYKDTATMSSGFVRVSKIILDKDNEYSRQLSNNLNDVQGLKKKTYLLFGKVKSESNEILTTAENFYTAEIKAGQEGKANIEAFNVIITMLQDYNLVTQHLASIGKYTTNPIDISTLEKYSRSDWTLSEGDQIKSLFPYRYEVIQKYRNYLGEYWLLTKDVLKENYESALYKFPKLVNSDIELTADWSRVVTENEKKDIDDTRNRLEQAFKLNSLFYSFNNQRLGKYPFTKEMKFVITDPLLCNLYVVKTSLFHSIKDEYPKSNQFNDLLSDLSTISPKTDELDKLIDYNSVVYSNNDKEISFICKDKQLNRDYMFVIEK